MSCQNNNNLRDGERIRALRLYLSLSRINLKPILKRLAAAALYRSEKGNKLPQLIQALSRLLPSPVRVTTGMEGLQTVQSGCLVYFFSLTFNVTSRQSFSLMCGLKKAALPETSSLGSIDIQAVGKISPDFWKMHFLEDMSQSMSPDKAPMISWQNSEHSGFLPTDLYLMLCFLYFSFYSRLTLAVIYNLHEEHITTPFPLSCNSVFPSLLFLAEYDS